MTKEEAWKIYWDGLLEPDNVIPHDYPQQCDVEDAFDWAWEKAIESVKPAEENIPFKSIIDNMNDLLGKKFKLTLTHKSLIRARWREGMRESEFDRVVRIKKAQWKDDPAMAIYLRPETLFGTKMDAYNNEPEPKQKRMVRNHLGLLVEVEE